MIKVINVPMKSNNPIRTTDLSKSTFRVYMPKRSGELSTAALSRIPDQSQENFSSRFFKHNQSNNPRQNQYQNNNYRQQGNMQNQPQCPPQNNYYGQQGNAQNQQQRPPQNNYYGQQGNIQNQQQPPQNNYYGQQGNAQNQQQRPAQYNNNTQQTSLHNQNTPAAVPQQAARKRPQLPPPVKSLKKGEKYSITKNNPGVDKLKIGVGWDFSGSLMYDVDVEAFMLNDSQKVPDDSWIVFYGQLKSPDGSVIHKGDSSNTNLGADCEQIDVDLGAMSTEITKIAFVVTIDQAKLHGYNFSGMKNAYIRISDIKTGKEILRYELTDYYREVVSMVVGELYFRNGEWRFNPVGMGTNDDLEGLCNKYGIEVK